MSIYGIISIYDPSPNPKSEFRLTHSRRGRKCPYIFGVKRVIHITLMKLMLITNIQYKEVGNVSQLLLKCINPSK